MPSIDGAGSDDMSYGWRPMRAADLSAVSAMSDAVHGAFTEAQPVYAERLALWPQGCRILETGAGVAGYLIAHPWRLGAPPALGAMLGTLPVAADVYYLHDIALLPAARGTGAGAAALGLVLESAVAARLPLVELVAVNGADTYWRAQGFEAVAPGPYGAGSWLMRRLVNAPHSSKTAS